MSFPTDLTLALIDNNIVVNTVVGDSAFAVAMGTIHESVVDISGMDPRPAIGWAFVDGQFRSPSPYPSWTWEGGQWRPPTPLPTQGGPYYWDETTMSWVSAAQIMPPTE